MGFGIKGPAVDQGVRGSTTSELSDLGYVTEPLLPSAAFSVNWK